VNQKPLIDVVDQILSLTEDKDYPDNFAKQANVKEYERQIDQRVYQLYGLTTGLALEALDELPLMVRVIRNLCTIMAGAEPVSLPIEIQSEATNITSYDFSLSNGEHLVALWTDGVAVDEDPGIEATLTISGFPAKKVADIDVLNGFEQQMITDIEDGNLVIRNLLVKDYPMILRLTP